MRMNKITPVILSGGFGKRLWPISRKSSPKQFLKIPFGSKISLFQKTVLRTNTIIIYDYSQMYLSAINPHSWLIG